MSSKTENRIDANCRAPGKRCRERKAGMGGRWESEVTGWRKWRKRKRTQKSIIQSRIGQRSCRLRDRTQNDVGVPPGPGTTHRRQNKCTHERVRTVVVALVVGETAETTTMMRKILNESSIVSTFSKTFGKLRPVRNNIKKTLEAWSVHPSNVIASQMSKGLEIVAVSQGEWERGFIFGGTRNGWDEMARKGDLSGRTDLQHLGPVYSQRLRSHCPRFHASTSVSMPSISLEIEDRVRKNSGMGTMARAKVTGQSET